MGNPNTREFYDAYWCSEQCASYLRDTQLDAIARTIVSLCGARPKVILDIGGGVSRIARLAKAAGHIPVVLDWSQCAVDTMRAEGISAKVVDIAAWRSARLVMGVDVATCTEVLEHLDRPEQAVRMAAEHAGRAFFTAPNDCMGPDTHAMHVRRYTQKSLTKLLRKYWRGVCVEIMYRWLVAEVRQ